MTATTNRTTAARGTPAPGVRPWPRWATKLLELYGEQQTRRVAPYRDATHFGDKAAAEAQRRCAAERKEFVALLGEVVGGAR